MVKHSIFDKKGKFYIEKEGIIKAEMHYSQVGENQLIIAHTEVDKDLRGQGVGKKMLLKLVDFARQNDFTVKPMCSYARSVFEKEEEIRDVLS